MLRCERCGKIVKKRYRENNHTDAVYDFFDCIDCLNKRKEVKVDGTTTDGIPSKTKVLGILPNEL